MSEQRGDKHCPCADPENCREPIPGYRCRRTERTVSSTPTNDMQLWQGPWNDGPAPYYKIPCADYHRLQQKIKDEEKLRESWREQASIWQQRSTPSATRELHIVFDDGPGPEGGRFVEVETAEGKSVNVGEWRKRPDGLWSLVLKGVS